MRILSQNGEIDIPYDKCVVGLNQLDDKKIIAWWYGCDESEIIDLAEYSSKENAMKALYMLHEIYNHNKEEEVYREGRHIYIPVFRMPHDKEIK